MHVSVQKLIHIEELVKSKEADLNKLKACKIIAVSKTFSLDKIMPLINHGHYDYGENKVQEALDKWTQIKAEKPELKLHLLGKLQTNKVKFAIKLFDFIHSVDSKKLAKKIHDEQLCRLGFWRLTGRYMSTWVSAIILFIGFESF